MKVLLLTWDYPPIKGGIQIWMYELARRLPEAEVTVFAPGVSGSETFDVSARVRVRRLCGARLGPRLWTLQSAAVTMANCLTWRPDVVICGHVVTAPAAFLARRLFGIPYAVFTHAYEIRRRASRRLVGFLLRSAALVLANSRFTRNAVLAHGVPPTRVRTLFPGTDPERFPPEERPDGLPGVRPRMLLSVSRLNDLYKGHDTVIRALPLIKAKFPDLRYLIAGDGRLRDYLHRLARSLGVEHDVVFLGEVSDEELPGLYRKCDVLVQVSREAGSGGGAEGFGIVCLEAAACGKPVVAGRSGGLPDAVSDGITGILVDPKDIGAVAEAILTLLQDTALAQRMGREGRARVLREFTWDHMAREARRLFAEVTGQNWGASRASSS
jgi:phosphatidylinositol alpha-1,6-mannosyltransferase